MKEKRRNRYVLPINDRPSFELSRIGTLDHVDIPCPIEFSESERLADVADAKEWQEAEDGLVLLQSRLGVGEDGWVENEHYDDAVAKNEDFKREMMEILPEGPLLV